MATVKKDIIQAMAGLELLADESYDANVVRGAYKLMRQIEEFVQQLPEEGREAEPRQMTVRKGKPGRKKKMARGTRSANVKQEDGA